MDAAAPACRARRRCRRTVVVDEHQAPTMRRPRCGRSRRTSVDLAELLDVARAEEFLYRLRHHEAAAAAQAGNCLRIAIAHAAQIRRRTGLRVRPYSGRHRDGRIRPATTPPSPMVECSTRWRGCSTPKEVTRDTTYYDHGTQARQRAGSARGCSSTPRITRCRGIAFHRSGRGGARADSTARLLARAYHHSAQLRRAEDDCGSSSSAIPVEQYARLMLGRTLERQGRQDEADAQLRIASALAGDFRRPLNVGVTARRRYGEAG